MYVVLGKEIVDSNEIAEMISLETDFVYNLDISKSTKREDVVALRFKIRIEDIPCDFSFDVNDEEIFNEYMNASEEMMNDYIEDKFGYKKRYISGAYKWDEIDNSIYMILVISDISLSYMKLKDVFNRLIRQND